MKRLALLVLLVAGTSCNHVDNGAGMHNHWNGARHGHPELQQFVLQYYTPDMTLDERNRAILRGWDWEGKQFAEDVDTVLLLRPMSRLTKWNLR